MFKKIALLILMLSLVTFVGCKKEVKDTNQHQKNIEKSEKKQTEKNEETQIDKKVETKVEENSQKDENSKTDKNSSLKSIKKTVDDKTLTFIAEFEGKISENIPKATFYVSGKKTEESSFAANSIKIAITGNINVEQELKFDDTETADEETIGLILEDINFDGFKDLRIQEMQPAGANVPYLYWIWNKDKSLFERNSDLDIISNPVIDSTNKKIISEVRDSATTYFTNEYKFEKDKLIQTKEIKKEYDENDPSKAKFTVKELKNGKLTVVKTYIGKSE